MIEFIAGIAFVIAGRLVWRALRPHRHSAAPDDRRLGEVVAIPMSEAEVRRAADRIRRIRAAEHQRSTLPPVA